MRHGLAVVCLMAAACASENELRFTSTLQAETNGVVLSENGLDMYAAMSGTTCTIDANWGCPVADADLPTSEEKVVDHWDGVTLGASSLGLHVIDHGKDDEAKNVLVENVRTASLSQAGRVMVYGNEDACFYEKDGETVEVDGSACADDVSFSVDRSTGALFAATASGVVELGVDRSNLPENVGDLADFDPRLRLLYTAFSGSEELRAFNRDREQVWEVHTTGAIRSLTARGQRGEVLVLVDRPNGLAAVERRDGENGRLLGTSIIPTSDGQLETSDNGRTIAVVRKEEVNFFALDDDTEPVIDDTPPNCIVPTANGQDVNLGD